MTLAKRIIPCLDVDNGRVVKGVKFVEIRDAGDPVEIARRYNHEGADELTFLDITASSDNRDTMAHVVEAVAREVFIPLTVGGGIRELADIRRMLNAGADKVSINTAAVFNPEFVAEAADKFGSQCIVVAVDAKRVSAQHEAGRWEIFTHGGRKPTGIDVLDCTLEAFRQALTGTNHTIKRALTDPRIFSGIGNAYSDEILHRARLSPIQAGPSVKPKGPAMRSKVHSIVVCLPF